MRSASSSAGAGARSNAVGLYVPGGTAAYPSSVLMNAVPAKVAGVPRVVMVVPSPDGKLNPLVLAAAQLGGVSRNLPRRRRAGDCRARLWHRDHRAGRQDRRPRQCLCRRRQAAGVRQGRHRHDRRPLRGAGHRRRHRQCRLDRRRSAGAGRARRQRAVDPDHRQRRLAAEVERAVEAPARRRCRAQTSRGASWNDFGAIIMVQAARRCGAAGERDRRRASRDHDRGSPRRSPPRSATPARSSSGRIRPRRSAIMSAAPTTCCRPRARRGSPRASACSTS